MKLGDWIPFGAVPSIEARVLHARLEGGEALQLVDVRTLVEHRTSRIAGAVSAPIASLAVQLEALDLDLARPEGRERVGAEGQRPGLDPPRGVLVAH